MFCEKCGTKVEDGDLFCSKCGNRIVTDMRNEESEEREVQSTSQEELISHNDMNQSVVKEEKNESGNKAIVSDISTPEQKVKKIISKKTKVMACVFAVILCLLGCVGAGVRHYLDIRCSTLDFADYVEITYEGWDGYAEPSLQVNDKDFLMDFYRYGKMKGNKSFQVIKNYLKENPDCDYETVSKKIQQVSGLANIADLEAIEETYHYLIEQVEYSFDKKAISNGDELTLSIEAYDTDEIRKYGILFKESKITEKVEGLLAVNEINPSDYFGYSLDGISPNLKVNVECEDEDVTRFINYTVRDNYGLKNGDTVTIDVVVDKDGLLEEKGLIASDSSFEIKVDAGCQYITKIDEIRDDAFEDMIHDSLEEFREYVKDNWVEPERLLSVGVVGCILNVAELDANGTSVNGVEYPHNIFYLILKVEVDNPDEGKMTYYTYASFEDLIVYEDGSVEREYPDSCRLEESEYGDEDTFDTGTYYYTGFKKYKEVSKWIQKIDKNYTSEAKREGEM